MKLSQYINEESRSFSEWFKNSKAVDESNKPLIVYHGGSNDPHYFTVDKKVAEHFGTARSYYLKIENPWILKDTGSWSYIDYDSLIEKLGKEKVFDIVKQNNPKDVEKYGWKNLDDYFKTIEDINSNEWTIYVEDVVAYIRTNTNHDGIIFKGIWETESADKRTTDYVVFNANQIWRLK